MARGSTVLPEGLMWGWRVMSPNQPFPEGAAYTDKKCAQTKRVRVRRGLRWGWGMGRS